MVRIRFAAPVILLALGALSLTWTMVQGQGFETLPRGEPVAGEVDTRLGDEWIFQACAGEVVTVLMESDEIAPALELFGPSGRDPIGVGEETAAGSTAGEAVIIEDFELPESGEYLVAAAGRTVRERGAYTLVLTTTAEEGPSNGNDAAIAYGETIEGEVANRLGEERFFFGCQGDVVTISMTSEDFGPGLQLFSPSDRDAIATSEGSEDDTTATIEEVTLEETGTYLVAAIGQTVRDRGQYSLTLELVDQVALTPTATATRAATPTRTRRATTPTRTRTPSPTPTPDGISCLVVVPALNVRSGPGTEFTPPIDSIARGDAIRLVARNDDRSWVEIEDVKTGRSGWISASNQFLNCEGDLLDLPLGDIPPTPTPTNTPLPTATFTPGPPPPVADDPLDPIGVVIDAPGAKDELLGDIYTMENYGSSNRPIFRDRFSIELFVWDPKRGKELGDGIDQVTFTITLDGEPVYDQTERSPRYCSFAGGEPDCNVIRLRPGAKWPGSDNPIRASDGYEINATAFPKRSGLNNSNWNFQFELDFDDGGYDNGGGDSGNQGQLHAEFAQTFGGSNHELVFQVIAYDSGRGNNDGDGIDSVKHEIFGPGGNRVYERTENSAHYCAFSGGEPDCDVFRFTVGETNWEGTNNTVEQGQHTLQATVRAEDGRTVTIKDTIQIQ